MLWNSQYSAIVNWINKGNNKKILTDTNIGYHEKVANTGKTEGDIVKNIFDLSGNITETCMGVISNSSKITRGGNYAQKGGNIVAYKKQDAGTASIYQGTRMSLYIIDENDDVDPYLSKREDGLDKDENKKEICKAKGVVKALGAGETGRINISMSGNFITAYDIEFSK